MEKWKLVVIGLLLLGLIGYGISPQQAGKPEHIIASLSPDATAQPEENKAANFIGQKLGAGKLVEWPQVGPWENAKQPVSLDSLQGQPALIEFFSIDCSHCQQAAPFMERLYQRYQSRGLKMVAVQSPIRPEDSTRDETQWPRVQKFVKAGGLTYPVGMDKDSRYFRQIEGKNWPMTMLANPSGQIVHAETGHTTEKAITLAVELEKQLPGKGTPQERAADLAKFLRPFVFDHGKGDAALNQSLTDDLEQRLMAKV